VVSGGLPDKVPGEIGEHNLELSTIQSASFTSWLLGIILNFLKWNNAPFMAFIWYDRVKPYQE
jgi:hypothetical protein